MNKIANKMKSFLLPSRLPFSADEGSSLVHVKISENRVRWPIERKIALGMAPYQSSFYTFLHYTFCVNINLNKTQ